MKPSTLLSAMVPIGFATGAPFHADTTTAGLSQCSEHGDCELGNRTTAVVPRPIHSPLHLGAADDPGHKLPLWAGPTTATSMMMTSSTFGPLATSEALVPTAPSPPTAAPTEGDADNKKDDGKDKKKEKKKKKKENKKCSLQSVVKCIAKCENKKDEPQCVITCHAGYCFRCPRHCEGLGIPPQPLLSLAPGVPRT